MTDAASSFVGKAVNWALSQVGSTAYATKCLGFVEDAYEVSNDIWLDGYASAKEEADAFGVIRRDGDPPRGTFVFYDCWGTLRGTCRNWGHVGISLGDGRDLDTLLSGIELAEKPILDKLVQGGVEALFNWAVEKHDYQEDVLGYIAKCHLCLDIRRHLIDVGVNPPELEPLGFYANLG